MSRSYNDELQYLDKIDQNCWRIRKGFVPNMKVGNCNVVGRVTYGVAVDWYS